MFLNEVRNPPLVSNLFLPFFLPILFFKLEKKMDTWIIKLSNTIDLTKPTKKKQEKSLLVCSTLFLTILFTIPHRRPSPSYFLVFFVWQIWMTFRFLSGPVITFKYILASFSSFTSLFLIFRGAQQKTHIHGTSTGLKATDCYNDSVSRSFTKKREFAIYVELDFFSSKQ